MSNRAKVVKDFRKDIPGIIQTVDNESRFVFPEISSVNSKNKPMSWQIMVTVLDADDNLVEIEDGFYDSLPDGYYGRHKVYKRINNGPIHKTSFTLVKSGKNIGRSNETNPFTQALRDAYGLYKKQKDKSVAEVPLEPGHKKRFPPMLVNKVTGDIPAPAYVQKKYNGVRTVTTLEHRNGVPTVLMYSRNKKEYLGKEYIKAELMEGLTALHETGTNLYLDGELYLHGTDLQTISGESRADSNSENPNIRLEYHVYDCFLPDRPKLTYTERMGFLDTFFLENGDGNRLTYTVKAESVYVYIDNNDNNNDNANANNNDGDIRVVNQEAFNDKVNEIYAGFLNEGFEGAIVRNASKPYRYSYNGYHSSNLLKMKPTNDAEFTIVGYDSGKKGKAKDALMWICETDGGQQFNVTPMGTIEGRIEDYHKMSEIQPNGQTLFEHKYLGKMMTVLYDELSADDVPLRARAIALRDYE